MSVLMNSDKKELIINCKCGYNNSVFIKIDDKDKDADYYAFVTYLNGNWYRDQCDTIFGVIKKKAKKIWSIIRNKDYYYSDIYMSCEEFQTFKEYINQF